MDSIQTLKHDVVQFKDRKVQLVYEECGSHSGQRCEAHCSRCNIPICMFCVINNHNGHTIKPMKDVVTELKSEIQHETRDIESNLLPLYKEMKKNTDKDIGKSTQKFNSLESDIEKLRKSWQQEVDAIFNKFCSLNKSMRENHLFVLTSHQSLLENQIQEMTKTVQQNKEIHQSNKVSEVTKHQSKLTEYKEIPTIVQQPIPSLKSNTDLGKELTIELGEYTATLKQAELPSQKDAKFSSLTTRDLLDKAKVISTFPTGVESLWRISCLGTDEAWLSGKGKTITRVDVDGFVRESVTSTCQKTPVDIAVTKNDELIYSDSDHGTVNIVKNGITMPIA
uniref:B box-type domain-containing protein n=1 Tax=Magallana gigas TaxID=29159 RepID=A0A8W8M9P4_MAGGI